MASSTALLDLTLSNHEAESEHIADSGSGSLTK